VNMNALAPPKQKRAPAKGALPKRRLLAAYHATAFLARVLGALFWFFEQKRTTFLDRIDNESGDDGDNQRGDE
jgi:hypothetical protein